MQEQKPLQVRNNNLPTSVNWAQVSEVQVWGWTNADTNRFLTEALTKHRKAIRPMDDAAREARESSTISIDER